MKIRTYRSVRMHVAGIALGAVALAAPSQVLASTAAEVRQEVAELAGAMQDYAADERSELEARAKSTLHQVDAQIEALQMEIDHGADRMSDAALEKRRRALQALRDARMRVAEWYGALRHGSASAWTRIRNGFSDAWRAMQSALERSGDSESS